MSEGIVAGWPLTSPAEYVRRERAAGSGLLLGAIAVGSVGTISFVTPEALRGAAVLGTVTLGVIVLMVSWLRVRPVRRAWAAETRGTAVPEPLTDAERVVLRRGIGRVRIAGFISLGSAVFLLATVLIVVRVLVQPEVRPTSSGAALLVGAVLGALALFAAGAGWVGLRRVRVAGRVLRRLEAPGAAAMRVRGPLAARGAIVPRLGGVPLLVTDTAWRYALTAAHGAERAELLLAPTFADEPALGAARVLVAAPAV